MPKKILLADDSITIQKVVELTFSDGDYEVTAVNNGAKAIQKLGEMRPDIVLSDIIMPEKNGYEVCEYVKSHPELRHLPVILLTGTFEPFDPDRAEKAGCDAVVTKPFESQSLIHKVEELISQSQQSAPAASASAPPPEPPPSPWFDERPPAPEPPAFSLDLPQTEAPPAAFTHDSDIFGGTQAPEPPPSLDTPADSPFASPPEEFGGETRAFPRMTFEEMQRMVEVPPPAAPAAAAPEPPPSAVPEPPPPPPQATSWNEPPAPPPPLSFGDESAAPAAEPELESPFGASPDAEEFSGETRAFPRMTLADIQKMEALAQQHKEAAQTPPASPEPAPWVQEPTPAASEPPAFEQAPPEQPSFGGMTFESTEAPEPERSEPLGTMPWDEEPEQPAFAGQAPAFTSQTEEPQEEPPPQQEPPVEEAPPPAWAPPAEMPPLEPQPEEEPARAEAFASSPEGMPFSLDEPSTPAEPEPPAPEQPAWPSFGAAEATAEPAIPETIAPEPSAEAEADAPAPQIAARGADLGADLTDAQVDRIARRVVEIMSEQVVRNIAWEVIPDLAEMVVKERIRQLENE